MKMKYVTWNKHGRYLLWLCILGLGGVVLGVGRPALLHAIEGRQVAATDQIHLAWVSDPATTMTIVWRTASAVTASDVQYRVQGSGTWIDATGSQRTSGITSGALHEIELTGLTADTAYEYRVLRAAGTWSDSHVTRTAVASGPATFDVVYVADTGLIGRTDGLATGTEQVIDEIATMNPLLILPGGDYAYYNTEDDRFSNLNDAIDSWFDQMQPAAAQSPMMPTYGNHEVLLGENVDDWLDRFPTPTGYDGNRHFYSFDIGDVHFISIFAPEQITDTLALDWIDQDISDAKTAGQKWIIPYFHVSPFVDGTVHPSSNSLRNNLGPIFESHDVPLVISSHDQAYERTWPIVDADNAPGDPTNTTTTSRACIPDAEGVTWIKVSPGGKMSSSNRKWGFSPFGNDPAPAWTSVRSNTLHNFTRLRFDSAGTLTVEIWGVVGDGSTPVIIDSFVLADSCSEEIMVDQPVQQASLFDDETDSFTVNVTHSNGATAGYTVSSDQSWLIPQSGSGTTADTLQFDIDPSGLAPGTYVATATLTPAAGTLPARIVTTLNVLGDTDVYQLWVSDQPDRSNPVLLQDQTITGNMYVFTLPESGSISQVRFFLDDANHKRESGAPYDFAGSVSSSVAEAYDTTTLSDGVHLITADVAKSDGTLERTSARFTVSNSPTAVTLSQNNLETSFSPELMSGFLALLLVTFFTVRFSKQKKDSL